MPTATLDRLIGKLMRRCPLADYFLALDWVEEAFRTVWEHRKWSWRTKEAHVRFNAVYNTGTCAIIRGTDVVNFVGTALDGTYIGRQWRPGSQYPIYTIIDVTSTTAIQIDRIWSSASLAAGSTYEIYNALFELASDADSVLGAIDPSGPLSPVDVGATREELDLVDPQRNYSGGPVSRLALYDYAGSGGAARYEAWPHQKSDAVLIYTYDRRMPDLSDDGATIPPYLTEDVLTQFALAECAGWPGFEGRPNPYYRLGLIEVHQKRAMAKLLDLEVADQSRVITDIINPDDDIGSMFDDGYHQNHDVGWDG